MRSIHHLQRFVGPICAATLLFVFIFTPSCTSPQNTLSERAILKKFNQALVSQNDFQQYVGVQTGTYECNDTETRHILRELEAAGLITYSVERYAWWEKEMKSVRKPYTVTRKAFYGSYNTTEYKWTKVPEYLFCDHYVVSVSLTRKGERLALSEIPAQPMPVDKDLQQPNIDPSKYVWNQTDLSEEWPTIPNPFVDAQPDRAANKRNEPDKETSASTPKKQAVIERIDSLQYTAFNNLVFESDTVYFLSHRIEGIKARNIQIFKILGVSTANAEVVCRMKDVSDAGRIISKVENGQRSLRKASFTYFLDKGWVPDEEFVPYDIFE